MLPKDINESMNVKLICISVLFYFVFVISPIQCGITVEMGGDKHSFSSDQDVIINWTIESAKRLDYYVVTVSSLDTNETLYNQTFPESKTSGSHNLGERLPGTYLVTITTKPTDPKVPMDRWSETFAVSQKFGKILIKKFYDRNGNNRIDSGEPLSGWRFKVGLEGSSPVEYGPTDQNGELLISDLATAKHIIVEIPMAGWTASPRIEVTPIAGDTKIVPILNSPPILIISNLTPPNNTNTSSNEVEFAWDTSERSTTNLYIRANTESTYRLISGAEGLHHSVVVHNLTRNTRYTWHAESGTGLRTSQSEERRLLINNGIIFSPRYYEFNLEKQYNQHCNITVKNIDSRPHRLLVNVSNPYSDIAIGFLGQGSAGWEITLSPGETRKLDLVINAQDASKERYIFDARLANLGPEEIVDYARIVVNVRLPKYDFTFSEVGTDPITLTKTFRVTNIGKDTITDLSIIPDESLARGAIILPYINHALLSPDESVFFNVSPIWSRNVGSISGYLTASAANTTKSLPVDFSCGGKLYEVILKHPLLHFDLNVHQCLNAPQPIEGEFPLPPGINAKNVSNAHLGIELDVRNEPQSTPYKIWVKINDNEIGNVSRDIVSGYYEFPISGTSFAYSTAGSAINKYSILDNVPGGYSTIITGARIQMCLDELRLYICAKSQQEAEQIAWSLPWIYRPSARLNVRILSPERGSEIRGGKPVTIKAEVQGDNGREKYSMVVASFSSRERPIRLVDSGRHADEQRDDGIYAGSWSPAAYGPCNITVEAGSCAGKGSNETFVTINGSIPVQDASLRLYKYVDPIVLNVSNMDAGIGNVVKYDIILCPIGGNVLRDVRVVDTLPSYMILDNNSLMHKADVQINHDGIEWNTTSIAWDLGYVDMCKSLTFDAAFRWRLPADAQHLEGAPMPISAVTYNDSKGVSHKLEIPEREIKIALGVPMRHPAPGFEIVLSLLGLLVGVLMLRRR